MARYLRAGKVLNWETKHAEKIQEHDKLSVFSDCNTAKVRQCIDPSTPKLAQTKVCYQNIYSRALDTVILSFAS